MTHWQRMIVYPWLLFIVLLGGLWFFTFSKEAHLIWIRSGSYFSAGVVRGSLSTTFGQSSNPDLFKFFSEDENYYPRAPYEDSSPVGHFLVLKSTDGSGNSSRLLRAPIWFTMILVTIPFLLLFLFTAWRRHRRKAPHSPQPMPD